VNVAIFDMGNVLLLAGIMLFPHGTLSWRKVLLIACLPLLMLTQGSLYQSLFVGFMTIAVLILLRCLRSTESIDQRQQIRWALLGITAYAVLRCLSIIGDYLKWSASSFGQQLLIELAAGVSFALAVIFLQLGLLIALIRYRLYDAEIVISRTVSVAIVTLVISGGFAAVMEGIITGLQFLYPQSESSQMLAAMAGAIIAASCLEPVRDRVRNWTERRFERNLFLLREDLPELVHDLRHTATLQEMVDSILAQVDKGVRAVRSAAIVSGRVYRTRGISVPEVEEWRTSKFAEDYTSDICEQSDVVFPIRVPLVPSSGDDAPIGFLLVGPRPDRSVASRAEQRALAGVAETVARAIRTVIKREVREQEVLDLIRENTRRIDQLEALLAPGPAPTLKRGTS
jgi:K+-sensing histidine kinase KdpD